MDTHDAQLPDCLPDRFRDWFQSRGWQARPHQLDLLDKINNGQSALLIAPTGAGKTLAGFLPSLIELSERAHHRTTRRMSKPQLDVRPDVRPDVRHGVHTLYISPLKALAVDIARNLEAPIREMELLIRLETRTGDTSQHKRQRQKLDPPDILLTTPEQVALLIASDYADALFSDLKMIVLDELHALVTSKRGELLSLGLARLRTLSPDLQTIGLSATVSKPDQLRAWLVPQKRKTRKGDDDDPKALSALVQVKGGASPRISVLESQERLPWSGHSALYALAEVYEAIKQHKMTLIFVNTRSQAELLFQEFWRINDALLPIGLHHGSLDAGQRRKVEAAMAAGQLKAVVCTSTLDLGIDWGDVDLVVHVGAPKGASRLAQRIGRANHRMNEPSEALLVPSNRFEVLECRAALDANYLGDQDTPPLRAGGLDVLAQHVLGSACAAPFDMVRLYEEVTSAAPYADLSWETFEEIVHFVSTGGYALKTYDRFARIKQRRDGLWRISHPRVAQQYRLNIGTIIEEPMIRIRLTSRRKNGSLGRGGRVLGEVEEIFVESMVPTDTFIFAGEMLRYEAVRENELLVTRSRDQQPKVPAYAGGKFPLSTYLADRVRAMLEDEASWANLPDQVRDWLRLQKQASCLPGRNGLLVETFPRADKDYMVLYPFEGRMAHQTLGMLLTRRLERAGQRPLGFVATDYALAIWGLRDISHAVATNELSLGALFEADMLGDDLQVWLEESLLLKRTFRNCAMIAGLIERRFPGKEKTGRQVTMSSDLIYNVLRDHEPEHILLRATWHDASGGLLDIARLSAMLARIRGNIIHQPLERISPLAVPVMLEIGREPIYGQAQDDLIAEAAGALLDEVGLGSLSS